MLIENTRERVRYGQNVRHELKGRMQQSTETAQSTQHGGRSRNVQEMFSQEVKTSDGKGTPPIDISWHLLMLGAKSKLEYCRSTEFRNFWLKHTIVDYSIWQLPHSKRFLNLFHRTFDSPMSIDVALHLPLQIFLDNMFQHLWRVFSLKTITSSCYYMQQSVCVYVL